MRELNIQGGFEGNVIKLKSIAEVVRGYEKTKSITKINGHEGIFLNVVKSSQYDIIEALNAVTKVAKDFQKNKLKNSNVKLLLLDDESFDVRNRLSLIKENGSLGFLLIIITLLIFLDLRSGFWVAMGIAFSFCCTIILSLYFGYTVNNMTLAAVIIVMGMVVDDAIVVAENIQRLKTNGTMSGEEAGIKGTSYVFMPIIASILTTCVAFIPLYFFSSLFGMMIKFIPPIIFIMLLSSLFESLIILPGHMTFKFHNKINNKNISYNASNWFDSIENLYGWILKKLLYVKWFLFIIFIFLLVFSFSIIKNKMNICNVPR